MPNYWIWHKAPLENEFTIQVEPCYDRDNHKVLLKPEAFSGSGWSDQLKQQLEAMDIRGVTFKPLNS